MSTCLFMEGWRGISVVPMGEKLVLLKGNQKEDVVKARAENSGGQHSLRWFLGPPTWWQHSLRGIPLHI